ncbi:MAG TPA: M1 family aminopeptidase [Thermoanaerobaculia bacterium]|nr:M1 family aminopeptidase [Thermoanaerobaculia bacterium]
MKQLLLALFLVTSAAGDEVARIEFAVLEPAKAVSVQDVVLNAGGATITLRRGTLIPASVTRDGAAEVVFVGEGTIALDPPDAIEASQLELFTGKRDFEEDFTGAVIVTAADAIVAKLRGGQPATVDVSAKAAARYDAWKKGPYRSGLGVIPNLLADHIGEAFAQTFFAALFESENAGEFLFAVDPSSEEEITLGQFIPEDLTAREKRRAERQLAREQRRGRGIGARVEDFGMWNTWMSVRLDPKSPEAGPAFRPEHYVLDVTIEPGTLLMRTKSRISMLAAAGGRRVMSLSLHPDLQVQRVRDANGAALPHHRWRDDLVIVLPDAPAAGSRFDIAVEYSGVAVEKEGRKTYAVRDPEHWYPQADIMDRATYDVTFRWPKKLQLLAAGRKTASGTNPDGTPWAKYVLETVTSDFGFEIGTFDVEEFKVGHVNVALGFDASGAKLEEDIRKEIRSTIETALPWLEEMLGAYPGDHLTVVTVPRRHSQSLLSFMTISVDMMRDYAMLAALLRVADRRAIVAHELSHQWWGHVIGWRNYRAQWISEAMAQYMAMRYTRDKLQFNDRMKVTLTSGWQTSLTDTTPDGRTVESVGPLVLGHRLSSSRAPSAYESIIYDKGALVMMMLARVVGEKRFDAALKTVIERAAFTLVSTEELIELLSDATKLEIEPFARQWIYSTGLPDVSYSYEFAQSQPGKWTVTGTARQNRDPHFVYRVARDPKGALRVQRARAPAAEITRMPMFVPVRIEVLNPDDVKNKKLRPDEGTGYVYGNMVVRGAETDFEFDVMFEPKRLKLDPRGEVLARFYDQRRNPRRVLYERAEELAADGKWSEAETQYRAALAADPTEDVEIEIGVNLEGSLKREVTKVEREFLVAQIHLGLARAQLEQERDAGAAASLRTATTSVAGWRRVFFKSAVDILEARLDLRRGDAEGAYRRLRKLLRDRDSVASAEAYLLLAIAAKQSNHPRELEQARERARKLGVDVSLLR